MDVLSVIEVRVDPEHFIAAKLVEMQQKTVREIVEKVSTPGAVDISLNEEQALVMTGLLMLGVAKAKELSEIMERREG